ncbi:MAG: MarR family winged helix-turn-helix transcriptional regulator [Clostridium sp.]|uniref:MarR family winged helix-turn-helix transcriptional regulator n=1 Tax=Clostridium TaxID=1485 RepID=UPI002152BF67|nr:MarR family transcriptional regulator [Clostridium sp. LY3-2]MCR6515909.1 MarR family transcriptional regulator [Clostridium sp. LY3-2]
MKPNNEFLIALYLRELNSIVNNTITKKLKGEGLTPTQITAIRIIGHKNLLTITELSEAMSIRKATASGIIDRLEGLNIVVREKDLKDKRITYIKFSKEGSKLSKRISNLMREAFNEVFKPFSEEEKELIKEKLENMIERLK